MAGIKRKSAAAAQPEVKNKSKKIKVDKPAKRSSDKDAAKLTKSSRKAKHVEAPDELEESDTSEPENGFYGFSASKDEDDDVSMSEDDEFVGDELEAALENETVQEKKKKRKEIGGKGELAKDKKGSKNQEAVDDKSSALAGLNGKRSRELNCLSR